MALDHLVSGAIIRLHSLERAVHDAGPWTMNLCGVRVAATRLICEDSVIFSAAFPEMDLLGEAFPITLECRGETVSVRMFTSPDYGDFVIDWELALVSAELAA